MPAALAPLLGRSWLHASYLLNGLFINIITIIIAITMIIFIIIITMMFVTILNIVNISYNVVIKMWSLWLCTIIRNHNSHKVFLISWSWCIQSCWWTRSVIENDIQCPCTSACERNNVIILMFRNTSLLTQLAQYWDIVNNTKHKW